ncbi:MAG: hypothetical protein Q9220_004485 [cf. Caloplaca sp. 1 TL-2023]
MQLHLPQDLHYPITVTELLKQPNDNVERFAPLFSYSYKTTVTEGNKFGDEFQVEKSFPTKFESSLDGVLKRWSIQAGTVISEPGFEIAEIDEVCAHDVQFGGMCVKCGQDMTRLEYVSAQVDAARATINMVHDKTSLVVSPVEAYRLENEAKRRLLASKKLSLVVDLDQTVIQACVEPTIGDWMSNPDNPNHEAVKDVREFQLVEDAAGTRGCWYYIKLRPGLAEFLDRMSRLYEMHIYTMGTRGYAQKIAQIIDPDRKYFGDRILSRDESGSLVAKNLQRLFPVDTNMVVIIDDRGDVWKWSDNLIKVTPYDFFVGIGDINASFLAKTPSLPPSSLPPPAKLQEQSPQISGAVAGQASTASLSDTPPDEPLREAPQSEEAPPSTDTSALEQLVSMGGDNDPLTLQQQTTRQDETLTAQLNERPLLKKQIQLEQEDAAKAASAASTSDMDHTVEKANGNLPEGRIPEKARHHILEDHDRQLVFLEKSLHLVHSKYFEQDARRRASQQGGRVAKLRGSQQRKQPVTDSSDLISIPDVKTIMPSLKQVVLDGVIMVLSGVVPIGWDIQNSDLAMWAKSFGARIEEEVTKETTHLIAARNRTAKVRQALKRGRGKVKVVSPQWLVDSLAQWTRVDETRYLLDVDDAEPSQEADEMKTGDQVLSESEDVASANESDKEQEQKKAASNSKPTLHIAVEQEDESDLEGLMPSELEDQHSPVGGTNEDWDNMHAELDDFLGSEADDSDDDGSVGSASSIDSLASASKSIARRPKRERELDDREDDEMRKRPARSNLYSASPRGGVTSEPGKNQEEGEGADDIVTKTEGTASTQLSEVEGSEDGAEWAEFEEEFAAEMEKAAAKEEGKG